MKHSLPRGWAWTVLAALGACAPLTGLDDYVVSGDVDGGAPNEAGASSGVVDLGSVRISPATITFGESTCGETKGSSLTITNPGTAKLAVEATLGANDTFTLIGAAADGTFRTEIGPNESRTLSLAAKNAGTGTRTAEVIVRAGDDTVAVPLALVTHGALLAFVPNVVDFGSVRQNTTPPPQPVVLRNDGDAPITVTGLGGITADFTLPSSVVVPGGGEATTNIAFKAGPAGSPLSATTTPILSGSLCETTPSLTLKGQRVDQDVTVNPATVELGAEACNTSPTTSATVTISNYSQNDAVAFQAAFSSTSRFKISPAAGTVPKAKNTSPGTTEISIGVNPTGAAVGSFDEVLDVTINAPAGTRTEKVKVHVDVTGAILAFSAPSLSFTKSSSFAVRISNTGNVRACFDYRTSGASRLETETDDDLAPAASDDVEVRWRTSTSGVGDKGTGTVTVALKPCAGTTAPAPTLCAPAPVLAVDHR